MAASTLQYEQVPQSGHKTQETKSTMDTRVASLSGSLGLSQGTTQQTKLSFGSLAVGWLKGSLGRERERERESERASERERAVPALVDKVKKHIFPFASAEAWELYKMGQ